MQTVRDIAVQIMGIIERTVFLYNARYATGHIRSMRKAYIAYDKDRCGWRYLIHGFDNDEDPAVVVTLEFSESHPDTPEILEAALKILEPTRGLRSCEWVFVMQEDHELLKRIGKWKSHAGERVDEWKTRSDVGKALADVEQLLDLIEAQYSNKQ